MAVNSELECASAAELVMTDGDESGMNGLDLLSNGDTNDSTRPTSAAGSHGTRPPSTTHSMSSVPLEERLKRMRAAEELKQQQRYAAFIESQRQAELVRMRAQEERKRKIEEMRQREEARRALVLERRRELELSNKARMESIRERSRARDGSVQNPRRRIAEPTTSFGRTASASPSLGAGRNPNQLMTTSCVVAFGSSAPRSTLFGRSNSSLDCHKLGRAARAPFGSVSSQSDAKPSKSNSPISSTSPTVGSARSNSVDALSKRPLSTHGSGVFNRLAVNVKSREKIPPVSEGGSKAAPKARQVPTQAKKPTAPTSASSRRPAPAPSKPIPKGMSVSVYADRTDRKRPEVKSSATLRKRSASPPHPAAVPVAAAPATVEPSQTTTESLPVETKAVPEKLESKQPTKQEEPTPSPTSLTPATTEPVATSPKPEPTAPTQPVPRMHTGPIKAETKGSGEGAVLTESEAAIYRAKLVEQRRLAKERKEEEQRRLEEENRVRRWQLETARLAAEQAAREQAEREAQEAAEQQRQREEEERVKLEAAEAERLAKLQRAEEERIMRKKKLDSIMSRVKQAHNITTASSPALQSQDEPDSASARADASDSKLFEHAGAAVQLPDSNKVPANSTDTLAAASDFIETKHESSKEQTLISTSPTKPDSVEFSLPPDGNDAQLEKTIDQIPQVDSTGDHAPSVVDSTNDAPTSSPRTSTSPDHQALNGNSSNTWSTCGLSSGPGSPGRNQVISSVGRSPSQGDLQSGILASEHLSGSQTLNGGVTFPEQPRFKSALLQSMLGGGRLSTRAKDAVAGLRRGSANQLSENQSLNSRDGSGTHSPVYWPQDAVNPGAGSDFIASRLQAGSRESLKYGSGFGSHNTVSMVQSMFDVPTDRYHINGSSVPSGPTGDLLNLTTTEPQLIPTDTTKPSSSAVYAWQATPDCDLTAPESMSPRPVHMSTN